MYNGFDIYYKIDYLESYKFLKMYNVVSGDKDDFARKPKNWLAFIRKYVSMGALVAWTCKSLVHQLSHFEALSTIGTPRFWGPELSFIEQTSPADQNS